MLGFISKYITRCYVLHVILLYSLYLKLAYTIRTKVRKRILFKEIGKQHAINNTQQIYTPDLQINTNYHARKLLLNNNTYSGVFKGIQHFPKEPGQNHKTYFP